MGTKRDQHECFTKPLADSVVDCSKARCLVTGKAALVFHWLELAHRLGGVEGEVSRLPWGGSSDFSPAELGRQVWVWGGSLRQDRTDLSRLGFCIWNQGRSRAKDLKSGFMRKGGIC